MMSWMRSHKQYIAFNNGARAERERLTSKAGTRLVVWLVSLLLSISGESCMANMR